MPGLYRILEEDDALVIPHPERQTWEPGAVERLRRRLDIEQTMVP